jgi:hypothetical protein
MSSADNQSASEPLVRTYSVEDQQALVDLWDRCGLLRPWNNPVKDISRKLRVNSDWLLLAVIRDDYDCQVLWRLAALVDIDALRSDVLGCETGK